MKSNTALSFFVTGMLFLYLLVGKDSARRNIIVMAGSGVIFLIALLTLWEHIFNSNLGIDSLYLIKNDPSPEAASDRMSFMVACGLMLLSTSIFFYQQGISKKHLLSDYLLLVVLLVSLIPLLAYLFDIQNLNTLTQFTQVPIKTAIIFATLSSAMLLAKTNYGIISVFTRNSNVSKIFFRQIVAITVLALLVALLRLESEEIATLHGEFGVFLFAFVFICCTLIILLSGAQALVKAELLQKKLTEDSQESLKLFHGFLESAPDGMLGVNESGKIVFVNKMAEHLFGYSPGQLLESPIGEIIPEASNTSDEFQNIFSKGSLLPPTGELIGPLHAKTKSGRLIAVEVGSSRMTTTDKGVIVIASFRDVSRRMMLEEALRHSEEHLRITLASIGEGVISTDAIGKIVFMNPLAQRLTGWTDKEAIGKQLEEVYVIKDESSGTPLDSPLRKIIELGEALELENHTILTTRDHRELIISNNGAPIRDTTSNITGAVLIFRDTTEKSLANRAIKRWQERFNTIFFNNPASMVISRMRDGQFIEVNKSFESLVGYSRLELIGKTSVGLDMVVANEREEIVTKLKSTGRLKNEKLTLRAKDGTLRPVMFTMEQLELDGEPCLLTTSIDISDWNEAERRYQTIFEKSHEGIYRSDAEGRFLIVNPSMARIFGYSSQEEMIGSIENIASQIYFDPSERKLLTRKLIKDRQVAGFEMRALKKNKELIWVKGNVHRVDDANGKAKYFEGTLEDVTDRKIAEKKFKIQFEELQKVNKELDRFVYRASHDLRAPLASILGILNLCELEKLSSTNRSYLHLMRSSIGRLDGFIMDILSYSRNSRLEVKFEEINFPELLTDAQANLKFMTGSGSLYVEMVVDGKIAFFSDKIRCRIIMENMLSNSIKYQDLHKPFNRLLIKILTTETNMRISFSDNGIGIYQQHLPKIFDMFYRATDTASGSGLGLYIVRECVEKLGGTVTVESEPALFTKFEIELPNGRP
ncbi:MULTISPECIES: PAS domain S-box protein [unclassified Imperialibacter]|nr:MULTISPECIES: PAS domain S-box protein [unclassified Imperialibacter]